MFFKMNNKKVMPMHWRNETWTYRTPGWQQPVFLCPNAGRTRLFVDVCDAAVRLQYTFDPAAFVRHRPADVSWHDYEAGTLMADFAAELYGPPTAMRLRIVRWDHVPGVIRMEIHHASNEKKGDSLDE